MPCCRVRFPYKAYWSEFVLNTTWFRQGVIGSANRERYRRMASLLSKGRARVLRTLVGAFFLSLAAVFLVLLGATLPIFSVPVHAGDQQTPTPPATPPEATPTVDRLAAPPTVENPTQSDNGAQLYWLHCQPCHGDRGQGLTDDWRAQYPPEDQNCWDSGCHGERPYESGFTLPRTVPALIGEDSLNRFETLGQVYAYASSAMPFQEPGHLSQEEYLAIVAFIGQSNNILSDTLLSSENVHSIRLNGTSPDGAVRESGSSSSTVPDQGVGPGLLVVFGILGLLLVAIGGIWLWRRYKV